MPAIRDGGGSIASEAGTAWLVSPLDVDSQGDEASSLPLPVQVSVSRLGEA
jgi:hypothetical protein